MPYVIPPPLVLASKASGGYGTQDEILQHDGSNSVNEIFAPNY
jgi:hypothetical protein